MDCNCVIKTMLKDKEATSIRNLFKSLGRKAPEGEILGVIDQEETKSCPVCPFKYSWGFEYYCDNQSIIKKYVINNKEKFPSFYKNITSNSQ